MQDSESPPPAAPEKLTIIPGKWGTVLMWLVWLVLGFVVGSALINFAALSSHGIPREMARRASCQANLNHIGKAIPLYAADNDDAFPPDLKALIDENLIPPACLVCRLSGTDVAETAEREDIESHCDYIYVAGMSDEAPSELVLAYELPANHKQIGVNILFANASTEWLDDVSEFTPLVQKSNEYLAENRGDE